jgi:hypothetical protein
MNIQDLLDHIYEVKDTLSNGLVGQRASAYANNFNNNLQTNFPALRANPTIDDIVNTGLNVGGVGTVKKYVPPNVFDRLMKNKYDETADLAHKFRHRFGNPEGDYNATTGMTSEEFIRHAKVANKADSRINRQDISDEINYKILNELDTDTFKDMIEPYAKAVSKPMFAKRYNTGGNEVSGIPYDADSFHSVQLIDPLNTATYDEPYFHFSSPDSDKLDLVHLIEPNTKVYYTNKNAEHLEALLEGFGLQNSPKINRQLLNDFVSKGATIEEVLDLLYKKKAP